MIAILYVFLATICFLLTSIAWERQMQGPALQLLGTGIFFSIMTGVWTLVPYLGA